MKKLIIPIFFSIALSSFGQTSVQKTTVTDEYRETVKKRSEKIVITLGIADSSKFYRVMNIIANQYLQLNEIDNDKRQQSEAIKQKSDIDKAMFDSDMKIHQEKVDRQLDSLHKIYLSSLATELTGDQIEKVKDGMTYGVLPITYRGYQEMLPDLTDEQKKTILGMLTEAREKAMDAGTSDEKHKWFGKYKGRINNYLSAEGYNMKKASEEWQARIKAAKSS